MSDVEVTSEFSRVNGALATAESFGRTLSAAGLNGGDMRDVQGELEGMKQGWMDFQARELVEDLLQNPPDEIPLPEGADSLGDIPLHLVTPAHIMQETNHHQLMRLFDRAGNDYLERRWSTSVRTLNFRDRCYRIVTYMYHLEKEKRDREKRERRRQWWESRMQQWQGLGRQIIAQVRDALGMASAA